MQIWTAYYVIPQMTSLFQKIIRDVTVITSLAQNRNPHATFGAPMVNTNPPVKLGVSKTKSLEVQNGIGRKIKLTRPILTVKIFFHSF